MSNAPEPRVGFIVLGDQGAPMAQVIAGAGFELQANLPQADNCQSDRGCVARQVPPIVVIIAPYGKMNTMPNRLLCRFTETVFYKITKCTITPRE
jgi:hypothetical protein